MKEEEEKKNQLKCTDVESLQLLKGQVNWRGGGGGGVSKWKDQEVC